MSRLTKAAAAAPRTRRYCQSLLDMIPGLADDIAKVIAAQRARPPAERLTVKNLYDLVRKCYPAYTRSCITFREQLSRRFGYPSA